VKRFAYPAIALYLLIATALMIYVPRQGSGYSWLWERRRHGPDLTALLIEQVALILCLGFLVAFTYWVRTLNWVPLRDFLDRHRPRIALPRKLTLTVIAVYLLGASIIAAYVPWREYVLVGQQVTSRVKYAWVWSVKERVVSPTSTGANIDFQPYEPTPAPAVKWNDEAKPASPPAPPAGFDEVVPPADIFDQVAAELLSRQPVPDYPRVALEELAYALFVGFAYIVILALPILRPSRT
jgi:hypothetical protein